MSKFLIKVLVANSILFVLFLIDRFLRQFSITLSAKGGFFVFEKNYFFAFGLVLPRILLYTLNSLILLILFFFLFRVYRKRDFFLITSFTLITLGAINNFIDRLIYGYIIDYFNFFLLPIFNLADLMIIVGTGLLVTKIFFFKHAF
jgi:signal peptidase II